MTSDDNLTVLQTLDVTNFDLLRLVNGGTLKSDKLFSIRTVRKYETKTARGQKLIGLQLQIVTAGVEGFIPQKDVLVKKVVEKQTVVKEVTKKPDKFKQMEISGELQTEEL